MRFFTLFLLFQFLLLSDIAASVSAKEPNCSILLRSNPAKYTIRSASVVTGSGKIDLLVVNLPCPPVNPYQQSGNIKWTSMPKIQIAQLNYSETDGKYISAVFENLLQQAEVVLSYETILYDVKADFSRINRFYKYDKDSDIYKKYTGASCEIVVPDNPQIKAVSKQLAAVSNTPLLYARNAYEYVAANYRYLNPNTGIHPLAQILTDGGGDCGNLSSIYISLLRCAGIPARHLVGIRPDGSSHVFADFYLEKYGWIPVDVTYKNSNPQGDFFGILSAKDVPVIVSIGAGLTVQGIKDGKLFLRNSDLMQGGSHWYWGSGGRNVKCTAELKGVRTD